MRTPSQPFEPTPLPAKEKLFYAHKKYRVALMVEEVPCECGNHVKVPAGAKLPEVRCGKCGATIRLEAEEGQLVWWARNGSEAAIEVQNRIAGRRARRRRRVQYKPVLIGTGFFLAGFLLYRSELDQGLLYLGTATLVVLGLIASLKGLLGYKL